MLVKLNKRQTIGFHKLGDIFMPGDKDLPRFSEFPFASDINRVFHFAPEKDIGDVLLLFSVARYVPKIVLAALLNVTRYHHFFPGVIGKSLREISFGLRGIFFNLYYSEKTVHQGIGYHTFIERSQESVFMDKELNLPGKDRKDFRVPVMPSAGETSIHHTNTDIELSAVFELSRKASQQIAVSTLKTRVNYVRSLKDIIVREKEYIIDAVLAQTGKSRLDALVSEIFATVDYLDYLIKTAEASLKPEKVSTPLALMGKKSYIWYESLGTVLIISPWNYPLYQCIVPAMSAFVAGNAVIYKPSEFTPLTGLIENLLQEAQFPGHYIQVVYGDGRTGEKLINMKPNKIFFTGGVETGKTIMQQASQHLIPVELELGGKDPMVVFADADMERASAGALWGAFTNAGQSCTSVERVYIEAQAYDRFKGLLLKKAQKLRFSVGIGEEVDVGRMTTSFQAAKVAELLEDALSKGADMLTGHNWDRESLLIPPIILENIPSHARITQEEVFGPILPLYKFSEEDEVVFHCNNSDYGLSASVWSAQLAKAQRVARRIITGNVSINNVMLTEGNPALPFGGIKASGIGRYKGKMGLRSFCNVKSVIIDGNSSKVEANWYPYTHVKYSLFSKMIDAMAKGGISGLLKFIISGLKLEAHAKSAGK